MNSPTLKGRSVGGEGLLFPLRDELTEAARLPGPSAADAAPADAEDMG